MLQLTVFLPCSSIRHNPCLPSLHQTAGVSSLSSLNFFVWAWAELSLLGFFLCTSEVPQGASTIQCCCHPTFPRNIPSKDRGTSSFGELFFMICKGRIYLKFISNAAVICKSLFMKMLSKCQDFHCILVSVGYFIGFLISNLKLGN